MQPPAMKKLQRIPGIGEKMSRMLWDVGIHSIEKLKGQNPEMLYEKLMKTKGAQVDRCVLYIFRCAVYYASHTKHDPHLLKWWNWTDQKIRLGLGQETRLE